LGKFLDLAAEIGLYAVVRPGPYICSEWDFGGLPWWLLKYPEINLRCSDPLYLEKCAPYLKKVCEIIRPRLITKGGNIIMVQIENEYGSYGNDKKYLLWLKDLYEKEGIDCLFVTSDGETEFLLKGGALDGVLASVNYRKDSERCISSLLRYHGGQVGAVMELWNGKAMHWGDAFIKRDVAEVAESVKTALENAEFVNLYMYHGGTNFGFMNGMCDFSDFDGGQYVQMTSYDVDAPLDEYGRRTPKYYAEREVILRATGKDVPLTAKDTEIKSYGELKYISKTPLSLSLCEKHSSVTIKNMEYYGAGYGYIVYKTQFFVDEKDSVIILPVVHDIAHVYIDGEYKASFERWGKRGKVTVSGRGAHTVTVLVENIGRVNFGMRLKDFKGLIGDLIVQDTGYNVAMKPYGYEVYTTDLTSLPEVYDGKAEMNKPAFYKYELCAEEVSDTVLNFEGFTRGVAFINGFNLGRHWAIENSPNKLFVPAPLIRKGKNEIVVFDVLANGKDKKIYAGEIK
ncbi:MAG: beta-galactosidase, partial [Clostridia bacterium]|nr:beta-galactosidase [Clostridia bacterium]